MSSILKIALVQSNFKVGDLKYNSSKIIEVIEKAKTKKLDLLCFPEMAISGYPPEDLLLSNAFHKQIKKALNDILKHTVGITCIVGHPSIKKDKILNSASVLRNKKKIGTYNKNELPNYGVFDEKRYFSSGNEIFNFKIKGHKIGLSICEDIWINESKYLNKDIPDLLLNLSASPFTVNKQKQRISTIKNFISKSKIPVGYCNLIGGQDELVFDGNSMFLDSNGKVVGCAKSFHEDLLVSNFPFRKIKSVKTNTNNTKVFDALVLGLKDYVSKNGFSKVVIGISGGVDSALVAAISVKALGKSNVLGIAMPSKYNTKISNTLAHKLCTNLGIKLKILPIQELFDLNLNLLYESIFPNTTWDITEENLQSRIRSNILMAISNKMNYMLLSTGNKSEMSMGYSTIYGDLAGGFAPLKDITKSMVYKLCISYNRLNPKNKIPNKIITREPSAELKHDQKDSDTLPSYKILDEVLNLYVEKFGTVDEISSSLGLSKAFVRKIMNSIQRNEFKRRQGPPGVKVTDISFGKDRRFPITNGFENF